jgi:hypothetical protein
MLKTLTEYFKHSKGSSNTENEQNENISSTHCDGKLKSDSSEKSDSSDKSISESEQNRVHKGNGSAPNSQDDRIVSHVSSPKSFAYNNREEIELKDRLKVFSFLRKYIYP